MLRCTLFLLLTLILAACGSNHTVTENQCRAGDWQSIGYRDGASGYASTRILAHQEACGELGIVPNRGTYMAGWNDGLSAYCTADSGFRLGQRGAAFNTVCNAAMREPFASAYRDGRMLYQAQNEVNYLVNLIGNNEVRLAQIKQDMVAVGAAQLDPLLTPEERVNLLAQLDALVDERSAIQADLPELQRALTNAESELDQVNQTLVSAGY